MEVFGKGFIKQKLATEGLRLFSLMLRTAGGRWLFVDGSFTTARERPSDWDGCFLVEGINPLLLDPLLIDINANRSAIKDKFRCDVFATTTIERSSGKPFREFFQQDQHGRPKGILVLDLGTVK